MKLNKTTRMTLTALFVALIFLFGLTPVGLIPLGIVNVTILCVPIIVGTILLGLRTGLVLGACFGAVSSLSAFGIWGTPSLLAGTLVAANPFLALIMCFVPRLMVPTVAHFVYKLFSNGKRASTKAVPYAAICGSLTNTILYLGLMLLFYVIMGINTAEVLTFIGTTALIAGSLEAIVAAVISTPILTALWKISKR